MRLKYLLHIGVAAVQLNFFTSALYSQSLLNVDFRGNSDHVKVGLAATGRTTNDYWNVCSFPSQRTGTISELKQSDETVTPTTLTLENGGGYWFKRHEGWNANSFTNNRQGIPLQVYRFLTTGYFIGGPPGRPQPVGRRCRLRR